MVRGWKLQHSWALLGLSGYFALALSMTRHKVTVVIAPLANWDNIDAQGVFNIQRPQ